MKASAFNHRLAQFKEFAATVPATPRNLFPRVEMELSLGPTRDQAKKLLDAETAAILEDQYGPAKPPKPKKGA